MKLLKTRASLLLGIVLAAAGAIAQEGFGDAHIAIENPADLPPPELEKIYDALKRQMADGYALAKMDEVADYQSWIRYNTSPYISATHGSRFVNNYGNEKGKEYGRLPEGGKFPPGTVFAKDSITVTDDGKMFPGALFIMEKLEDHANPKTADWRYSVINPDGSFAGDTTGDQPELVEYCHTCHVQKADQDYVFFVPEEFQRKQ